MTQEYDAPVAVIGAGPDRERRCVIADGIEELVGVMRDVVDCEQHVRGKWT